MGVDYRAVIAVGVILDGKEEIRSFLEKNGYEFTDEDEEYIDEDGFWSWLCEHEYIGGNCLNFYTGDYGYVGYDISCASPDAFKASYESAMEMWKKHFPNEEATIIKTVMVY